MTVRFASSLLLVVSFESLGVYGTSDRVSFVNKLHPTASSHLVETKTIARFLFLTYVVRITRNG